MLSLYRKHIKPRPLVGLPWQILEKPTQLVISCLLRTSYSNTDSSIPEQTLRESFILYIQETLYNGIDLRSLVWPKYKELHRFVMKLIKQIFRQDAWCWNTRRLDQHKNAQHDSKYKTETRGRNKIRTSLSLSSQFCCRKAVLGTVMCVVFVVVDLGCRNLLSLRFFIDQYKFRL